MQPSILKKKITKFFLLINKSFKFFLLFDKNIFFKYLLKSLKSKQNLLEICLERKFLYWVEWYWTNIWKTKKKKKKCNNHNNFDYFWKEVIFKLFFFSRGVHSCWPHTCKLHFQKDENSCFSNKKNEILLFFSRTDDFLNWNFRIHLAQNRSLSVLSTSFYFMYRDCFPFYAKI
jgi:hypothetical protein